MLTPASPSTVNVLAATPGCDFIPAPTSETLPISGSVWIPIPYSSVSGSSASTALCTSSLGAVNDMSARWPSVTGSFWMIMSTLTFASASAVNTRPATPGVSGTPVSVTRASSVEWVTAVTSGRSIVSCSPQHESTWSVLERRAAVDPHAVVARVLDRAQLQHAGAGGGHLEHLLERELRDLAGVRHDPRVGGEDAGDVGEDLADIGAQRGRDRHRGRVRSAAAERRHVAVDLVVALLAHERAGALEAGDQHDLAGVERLLDALGAHVDDLGLGVRGVGDDARLRPGQRHRPRGPGR